jgi:hypothetical protein
LHKERLFVIFLTMWNHKPQVETPAEEGQPARLQDAIREARIETAERSGVIVDLRDAELARLEVLKDALEPLLAEVPSEVELFDLGISRGDTPRLWIDAVAHVHMGRDKRTYRFVQDSHYGRKVLAESLESDEMVAAVTRYVARRLVERERALSEEPATLNPKERRHAQVLHRRNRWRATRAFLFGLVAGVGVLFIAAWLMVARG